MVEMEFLPNEIAILNERANIGLPMRTGERVVVLRKAISPNYDYECEFDDGSINPIRECELNKLTEEIKIYMSYIFTNNKVLYFYDEVTVEKCDYLHKKAEIRFNDESSLVVDFDKLHLVTSKEIDSVEEITVSNSEIYKKLLQEKYDVYVRKNADYGNSFEDQFNEYGLLSAIIRLDDKLRRLKQLRNSDAKVKDESIRDTALDMANYADMLVMALDKNK